MIKNINNNYKHILLFNTKKKRIKIVKKFVRDLQGKKGK